MTKPATKRPASKWRTLANQRRSNERYLIDKGVDLREDALGLNERYILTARCNCGSRIAALYAATEESLRDLKELLEYAFWRQGRDCTCTCQGFLPEPLELVDDILKALSEDRVRKSERRTPAHYFVRLTAEQTQGNT